MVTDGSNVDTFYLTHLSGAVQDHKLSFIWYVKQTQDVVNFQEKYFFSMVLVRADLIQFAPL